jgi:hypothetical protein
MRFLEVYDRCRSGRLSYREAAEMLGMGSGSFVGFAADTAALTQPT